MNTKLNILITAVGGSGHGEQILKAARRVKGLNVSIVGTDTKENPHQFEWVDYAEQLPPAGDTGYMGALLHLCLRYEIQAVFHGSEPEMNVISKNRALLEAKNVIPIMNSESVIDICSNKIMTMNFLEENSFNPPRFTLVTDLTDLEKIDYYPIIVKPYLNGGGSANVFIVQSRRELDGLLSYLSSEINNGLMVQEYVGDSHHEFTVGVLSCLDTGEIVTSVALKRNLGGSLNLRSRVKNRTTKTDLGESLVISSGVSEGKFEDYSEVLLHCENVAKTIGSKGSINFQGRLDSSGFRIFEINPRLSGTTSVRALAGYNEVEYLLRRHVLQEEKIEVPTVTYCTVERGLLEYIVS